jgi:hypothetical protein
LPSIAHSFSRELHIARTTIFCHPGIFTNTSHACSNNRTGQIEREQRCPLHAREPHRRKKPTRDSPKPRIGAHLQAGGHGAPVSILGK